MPARSFGQMRLRVRPRIQDQHVGSTEVISVAGYDAEVMQNRRCRNE